MDDIMEKLGQFLNSEEGANKLSQLTSMLQNNPDLAGNLVSGLIGSKSENGNPPASGASPSAPRQDASSLGDLLGGVDIGMLMKIQKALSAYQEDDKNTMLLKSLKPHLSSQRQGRVDEALKIMRLLSLLPLITESGLFGGKKS